MCDLYNWFLCVYLLLSFLLVLFSSRGFSFIYTAECVCVVVLASAEKSNCMNHIWPAENKNNMNRMSKGYWNIHTWCTKISEFWNPLETFVCQFSHPFWFSFLSVHSFRSGFHICTHACLCKCVCANITTTKLNRTRKCCLLSFSVSFSIVHIHLYSFKYQPVSAYGNEFSVLMSGFDYALNLK